EALGEVAQRRPDALVSDIEMPGQDGYSLVRKLRALSQEQGGKTPAVALTAFGRPEDRIRSVKAGFNIHLTKPVNPAELTAIVASLVGRAGGRDAAVRGRLDPGAPARYAFPWFPPLLAAAHRPEPVSGPEPASEPTRSEA